MKMKFCDNMIILLTDNLMVFSFILTPIMTWEWKCIKVVHLCLH